MYHAIVSNNSSVDLSYRPIATRPGSNPALMSSGISGEWDKYATDKLAVLDYNKALPQLELARIQNIPMVITARTQGAAAATNAASLAGLRSAQGQSQVLRARTKNLETTAAVSEKMQEPVKAEAIRALPWVIGGAVVLGLVGLILHRTKKK